MTTRTTDLAFRLAAYRRASRGPGTANDVAISITVGVTLLAVAGSVRAALVLRPETSPLVVPPVAIGLVGGSIVMAVLPLVSLFPRFSARARPEWPLTGFVRSLLDLATAVSGTWALGFTLVGAALLPWDGRIPVASAVAGLAGALVGTAGLLLSLQLMLELARVNRWSRLAAAVALAALFVGLRVAGEAGPPGRLLVPADLLVRLASGRPWGLPFALCLALGASPLGLGAFLHWRWLEARGAGPAEPARSSRVFRRALRTSLLRGHSPASRGVAAQSFVYLLRAGRYWFFALYVVVGAVFLAKRLPPAFSPEARAVALLLWGAAGSGAFYFNLFAFEGRALPSLLASPATGRDLLLGKQTALFAGSALYLCAAAAVAGARPGTGVVALLSSVALAVSFLLQISLAGAALSIRRPRSVDLRESFRGFLPGESAAVALVTFLVALAIAAGAFLSGRALAARLGHPALLVLPAAALLVASLALHRRGLTRLGRLLDSRRETLALSATEGGS